MPGAGNELPQGKGPVLFTGPEIASEHGWFRPHIRHLALRALAIARGQL